MKLSSIILIGFIAFATVGQCFALDPKVDLKFVGKYRALPKTSIVRNKKTLAISTPENLTLDALIKRFTKTKQYAHDAMKARYDGIERTDTATNPFNRERVEKDERWNAEFDCFLHAIKFEPGNSNSAEGDNDFHLVVGTTDKLSTSKFLNVEVSGLPFRKDQPDNTDKLLTTRKNLLALLGTPGNTITSGFKQVVPALHLHIKGSAFFDGAHSPGASGPGWAKPKTSWEIHPIYDLKPVGEPVAVELKVHPSHN